LRGDVRFYVALTRYEKLCLKTRPDYVVVVGDVNSTMAATITAKKLLIPVASSRIGSTKCRTMPTVGCT